MLKIEFSEADVKALRYENVIIIASARASQDGGCLPEGQRLPSQQICHLSGITANALRSDLRDYQRGGLWKCHLND